MRSAHVVMAQRLHFPVILCQRFAVPFFRDNVSVGIGDKLKQRREELNLSVAQVAARVKMAASTLYELERGDQRSTAKLAALCRLYDLNPDWVEFNRGQRLLSPKPEIQVDQDTGRFQVHGLFTTPEEVEVGIEWGKLREPARSLLREQVRLIVAKQLREERAAKRRLRDDGEPGPAGTD